MGESMDSELKPCPFCGATVVEVTNACTLEMCINYDQIDCPEYENTGSCYYTVCCDVNRGGCGASGGYSRTELGAVEKWNARRHSPL